jgi:propanol-preferring alcohol dehydrogenase
VLNYMRGDLGRNAHDLPRVPGHEIAGTIVAVGAGVDPGRVGEPVVAYFYLSCGACRLCVGGLEPLCENLRGHVGVQCDGGYAELCVLPAFNALTAPPGVDAVAATTVPDAVATPVHVARLARIAPGDRVVVIGAAGGVGSHMVQVARCYGAVVVGLDIGQAKLAFLEHELAVEARDSSDFAALELPEAWHGRADVVVDFVGRPESLTWAVESLAPAGRLVCTTTFRDVELAVAPRTLVLSQLSILGSRYASRYEVGLAAGLVASKRVTPIVSRRVPLEQVESLHDDLRRGTLIGRGALVLANTEREAT